MKILLLLATISLIACALPVADSNVGDVAQPLVNYSVLGIKVRRNATTNFTTDGAAIGAFHANVSKVSYGALDTSTLYRLGTPNPTPAVLGCNGNFAHDVIAVLDYGMGHAAVYLPGYRTFWLIGQALNPNDLTPECNVEPPASYGFSLASSNGAYLITKYGLSSDSAAIIGTNGVADDSSITHTAGGGAITLTHEFLHAQPAISLTENSSDFGHDGTITCTCSPNCAIASTTPGCSVDDTGAPYNFLSCVYGTDPTLTLHRDAIDETVENKYRARWFRHVARPEAQLIVTAVVTGSQWLMKPHDAGVIDPVVGTVYEIRIPRVDGRVVYLEYRRHMWTGCNGQNCGAFDRPGIYPWVSQPVGPLTQLYQVRLYGDNSTSYYRGVGPLPNGQTQIEPHLAIQVSMQPPDQAAVTVVFN